MKFTDGFWLMREGVSFTPAVQAYRVETPGDRVEVLAATKPVRHRGDTLNAATLSLQLDSPLADVIRVRVAHHAGGASALKFPLEESKPGVDTIQTPEFTELTSGKLTARIHSGIGWNLEFLAGGQVITHQRDKGLAIVKDPAGNHHLSAQLALGVGENVYGLGERFTSFIKNGQSIDVWNADGGTSSEQAYKNIPFYLTNAGYGVFINHTGNVSLEVASEAVEKVQFSAQTQDLEYLVIYGPTPKEILNKYTALTGRPPLLPEWSYGLWLSTSFVTNYDEATVSSFIDEMKARQIPISVFHFDCFWMREFQWCDFQWDPRTFPDPAGMLSRLKADGLRISLWINPYIAQASPLFEEAKALGYLLRRNDGPGGTAGSVWQWDMWQAGNAIVDFTNPAARDWFQSKLRPLLEMGVDCFKTDFGERIPTDVVYFDGSSPEQMHNLYTQLYNQTVFDLLREHDSENAIVFARSATVGGQTMPVHWGGDNTSSFESMAESLRGGLSLGLSGFGYWSHDIGGFEGNPDPAVFKRWLAFGLLSSHSRLHGNESVRVPWAFDEEAVDVTRKFVELKQKLMPYILRAAQDANQNGTPIMRAMLLEFPQDRTCWFLDQQYMFGPDLLVAPVFNAHGTVEFYLPVGDWTNYWTGQTVQGGRWITETHGFDSLPLYVRAGADIFA
jgi:alpha-D-xyloside xylohydrolase